MRIKVELRNRRALLSLPDDDELVDKLKSLFSFKPKGYRFHPKYRLGIWDGSISCLRRDGSLPAGLFISLKEIAEESLNIHFVVEDLRAVPRFRPFPKGYSLPGIELRPYQRKCVRRMIDASGTGGLVLNATGSGKTLIAGLYFRLLRGTAVFVVDELTLLDQARKELGSILGEPVGTIGDQTFDPQRISVATIQTLHRHRRSKEFRAWHRKLDVMVLDEIHILLNRRSIETAREMRPRACFGLTATLEIQKESVWFPAASLCGPQIFEYSYQRGRDQNYLAPGVVIGVDTMRNFETTPGNLGYLADYEEKVVFSNIFNRRVAEMARLCVSRGHHVAILVERIDHIKKLSRLLKDIKHECVYGERPKEERIQAKAMFDSGKLKLLIANRVFKKGINLKRLDVILDAANMRNANDARQKFGRGVRLCQSKTGLLYFDFGFKAVPGGTCRFQAPTRARRRALKAQGVPILELRGKLGTEEIYLRAKKLLAKAVADFKPSLSA